MSRSSPPPDNSLAVEQQRIAAENTRREQEKIEAEKKKKELADLRVQAGQAGRGRASSYFADQGLDPEAYSGSIGSVIDDILAGISPNDENPGASLLDVGQRAYDSATNKARTKAQRELDSIFAPNFETNRVALTLDDPYLDEIYNEQRTSADQIIQNMLDRGVITDSGRNAAVRDLDRQSSTVRTQLNDIGTGYLTSQQQALRNKANKGYQDAASLKLGNETKFDPFSYGKDVDAAFDEFIGSMGDQLKSRVQGDLFDTSGLGAIAGAAQGAQNTKFDPRAIAGLNVDDEEEENKKNQTSENVF